MSNGFVRCESRLRLPLLVNMWRQRRRTMYNLAVNYFDVLVLVEEIYDGRQ